MDFQFAQISENPTKEEIQREIERLKKAKIDYKNKNLALKIILNSVYGVAGYKGFICYNKDVAQSITKQSEDLIKYTIRIFNDYFKKEWQESHELHKLMRIDTPPDSDRNVINYADTDSVFLVLDQVFKESGYKKTLDDFYADMAAFMNDEGQFKKFKERFQNQLDAVPDMLPHNVQFIMFVTDLNEYALKAFVDKKMVEYIDLHNGLQKKMSGDKSMKLEMEQMNHSILWTGKKKYIKNPMWDEGKFIKNLDDIQVKGLELNQSATPPWVRGKLKELVRYIMEHENIDTNELIRILTGIKSEFTTVDIENICKFERVTNYQNLVLNDTTALEFGSGAKPHAKGAGYYNYLLYNSDYKNKYEFIETATRVHWYYTKGAEVPAFAFHSGMFPAEFAPPVNINMQFEKVLLGPLNNILKAIGIQGLDSNLLFFGGLW